VNGSEQLAALGVRLKVAGDKTLRVGMLRGLKAATEPLKVAVKAAAMEKLPKRGGLNAQVAGQKITTQVRTGARTAGVRLTTTTPDTLQTDTGYVRHKVFGNRKRWVRQEIPNASGWWSETLKDAAPEVTAELVGVMEAVSVQIQGGI
jgi:hypothetical protein